MREAHVSAEQPEAQEASRLPGPHAYPGRSGGAEGPTPARPHAPLGLIRPVRGRATFAALAGAKRHARNAITVRCVPGRTDRAPRVAYGVGRAVGGAVERNRVRRRLRAAVTSHRSQLEPGRAYLLGASPAAAGMSFAELEAAVGQLLATAADR